MQDRMSIEWESALSYDAASSTAEAELREGASSRRAEALAFRSELLADGPTRSPSASTVEGYRVLPMLSEDAQLTLSLLLLDENDGRATANAPRFRAHLLLLFLMLEDELRGMLRDVMLAHLGELRGALAGDAGALRSFERWWGAGQVTLGSLGLSMHAARRALRVDREGPLGAALASRFGGTYVDAMRADSALVECLMGLVAVRNAMMHEPRPGHARPTVGDYPAVCRGVFGHDSLFGWFDFGPAIIEPRPSLWPSASSALLHHHFAWRPEASWSQEIS